MFSVIMPAFNSEQFIEKAISSVLNQTYKNFELIIIDDKSDDGTCNIIEKYLKEDQRIIFHKLNVNSGPANARNLGIKASTGRYIAFIDSDDIWMKDKLEKQLEVFEKEECAVCYTSYIKVFSESNTKKDRIVQSRRSLGFNDMLWLNLIGCSTAAYDTKKCGKALMPSVRHAEDYAMWLSILRDGNEALGILEPLVRYNVRQNSESQGKIMAALGHWRALNLYGSGSKIKTLIHFTYYAIWHIFINKLKI